LFHKVFGAMQPLNHGKFLYLVIAYSQTNVHDFFNFFYFTRLINALLQQRRFFPFPDQHHSPAQPIKKGCYMQRIEQ